MRLYSKYKGLKGFVTLYNHTVRFRYMITETSKERVRILAFWEKHGTEAMEEAFKVKRRTLFLWQKKLKEGRGKIDALNPKKRIPKTKRKRSWDSRLLDEIRRLRESHKNLGKEKLLPLLKEYTDTLGLRCPSVSTIGRLLKDLGGLRAYPSRITGMGKIVKANRHEVLRKPKGFKAFYPGHCIALDTIEKQRNGRRMYVLVAEDLFTRTSFALATKSHASATAAHFLFLVCSFFPYPVRHILTDNGSEFKKHFRTLATKQGAVHFHTYPKTPKMNAHCERLNRTLQEEFIDYHANLLFDDITKFNALFADYQLFYNEKRVHHAFKNKLTPLGAMLQSDHYQLHLPPECKNGWTYTVWKKAAWALINHKRPDAVVDHIHFKSAAERPEETDVGGLVVLSFVNDGSRFVVQKD